MPLWNGSEIHRALAMPTLFLKAACKCPHVHQAQPLIWGSSNSKHSGGQGRPDITLRTFPLGFPQDLGGHRIYQKVHLSLAFIYRSILHQQSLLSSDAFHTTVQSHPHFFKFLCDF